MILIKTQEQINGIRNSCKLAAKTLKHLEQFALPGVTTEQLNKEAAIFIKDHGATSACLGYHGFPKQICTSINEVICHGIPSKKEILKEGDILNIDVTTILNGYYGDTSKMYAIGNISLESQLLMSVAKTCLIAGIREVFPGNKFGNIGYNISELAHKAGCSVVYQFCGHGVGIEFHEEPQIPFIAEQNSGEEMLPGMIFTIEPMVNAGKAESVIDKKNKWTARTIDGQRSAQYEHTVLVTDCGVEILTQE